MLFWFKKKSFVLDCFTYDLPSYDRFKIDRAAKYLPEWYKKLDKGNPCVDPLSPPRVTMKKCPGFVNYFKHSLVIPCWDYIFFRIDENDVENNGGSEGFVAHHSPQQYEGFLDSSYKQIKIEPPWVIKANDKVKFIQTLSSWNFLPDHNPEKLIHLPGIVDYYYQNSSNANFFIRKANAGTPPSIVTFEPGSPLVFLTPLEDIKIVLKHHLISVDEFRQRSKFISPTSGVNRIKINKKFIDKRDEESKCPFGFGKNK